jgi:DNA uptake protein ComE-like DNA-binding protein
MKRTPLSRLAWIAAAAVLFPMIALAGQTPKAAAVPATTQKAHATQMHRIDLNSATREELMALPGIAGAAADKVIEGRPWKSPQGLVQKNVISKTEFAKVKSRVMTKRLPAPAKM